MAHTWHPNARHLNQRRNVCWGFPSLGKPLSQGSSLRELGRMRRWHHQSRTPKLFIFSLTGHALVSAAISRGGAESSVPSFKLEKEGCCISKPMDQLFRTFKGRASNLWNKNPCTFPGQRFSILLLRKHWLRIRKVESVPHLGALRLIPLEGQNISQGLSHSSKKKSKTDPHISAQDIKRDQLRIAVHLLEGCFLRGLNLWRLLTMRACRHDVSADFEFWGDAVTAGSFLPSSMAALLAAHANRPLHVLLVWNKTISSKSEATKPVCPHDFLEARERLKTLYVFYTTLYSPALDSLVKSIM